jgi:hypothetical protein
MMSRAWLYEQHAKSCIQAADRIDNLDDCDASQASAALDAGCENRSGAFETGTGAASLSERKSVGPHERKVSAHSNRAPTFGLFDCHLPAHHRPWDASDRPAVVTHHLGWPDNEDAPSQGGDGSSDPR